MIIEQRKARTADAHSLDDLPVSILELKKDLNAILIKEDAQYIIPMGQLMIWMKMKEIEINQEIH